MSKSFRASAKGYTSAIAATPSASAVEFFRVNPRARKCFVVEGYVDGPSFVTVYDRRAWPLSFKDVTRAMAPLLKG